MTVVYNRSGSLEKWFQRRLEDTAKWSNSGALASSRQVIPTPGHRVRCRNVEHFASEGAHPRTLLYFLKASTRLSGCVVPSDEEAEAVFDKMLANHAVVAQSPA